MMNNEINSRNSHHGVWKDLIPLAEGLVRGKDEEILEKRVKLYTQKKEGNPSRRSGETRNWEVVGSVSLNPDRIGEAA